MKKFAVAYYSDVDGLDLLNCDAQNELAAISFMLLLKGFSTKEIDDCNNIFDVNAIAEKAGAIIKALDVTRA